jgi:hypothetical protein
VGNILDVVLIIKSDENLSLVKPPLAHQNYFSDKLFRGGPTFWLPGSAR